MAILDQRLEAGCVAGPAVLIASPVVHDAVSRLRYVQMYTPVMLERMLAGHPSGADLTSWRY